MKTRAKNSLHINFLALSIFGSVLFIAVSVPLSAQYQYRMDDNAEIIQRILEDRVPVKKRAAESQDKPIAPALVEPAKNVVEQQQPAPVTPIKPVTQPRTTTSRNIKQKPKAKAKGKAGEIPPAAGSDKTLLEAGINLYESGNTPAAIEKFSQLKSKFPSSPYNDQASVWLAKSHLRSGKTADALSDLDKIAEDSGEYPASLYLAGLIYKSEHKYDNATESFMKVSSRFPGHDLADDSLVETGKIFLSQKNGMQALAAATQIIRSYPDRETIDDAYYLIGMILEKDAALRDIEKARLVFKKFVYRAEVEKVDAFVKSPLLERVKREIDYLDKNFFKSR